MNKVGKFEVIAVEYGPVTPYLAVTGVEATRATVKFGVRGFAGGLNGEVSFEGHEAMGLNPGDLIEVSITKVPR